MMRLKPAAAKSTGDVFSAGKSVGLPLNLITPGNQPVSGERKPATEKTKVWREKSGRANGLWWTPADALLACEGGNRRLTRTDAAGNIVVLADQFEGKKLNSPNDLVQDGYGGIFFTDPRYGKRDNMEMDI